MTDRPAPLPGRPSDPADPDRDADPVRIEGEIVDDDKAAPYGGGTYQPDDRFGPNGDVPGFAPFDNPVTIGSVLGAVQASPAVRRAAGVPLLILLIFVLGPSIGNLLLAGALDPAPRVFVLVAGGIGVLFSVWLEVERRLLARQSATVLPRRLGRLLVAGIALAIGLSLLFMFAGFLALLQIW